MYDNACHLSHSRVHNFQRHAHVDKVRMYEEIMMNDDNL